MVCSVPRSQLTELYSSVSSYNLQHAAACLHRGGSLRVFTEAGLHMRLEPCSCELVWQGRDQVSGAGWEHWRWSTRSSGAICFLSSLLPPHYVEHNKASLIFKLVRHKCFLLPYFHRLCGGSPHLSHCDSSWEALGRRRPLYFSFPRDPLCPETPERAINKRTDGWWLCLW